MGIQDRSLPGNELPEEAMDFSFDDDDDEINPVQAQKRKLARRRKAKVETAECGACGADIPVDAEGCSTCGAKFE
jgi:ribosomal protein L40E